MWKVFSVLLVSLVVTTQGFLFRERDPDDIEQYPQEEVNNACHQYSSNGDCSFYNCLEKRFPCGREGFAYNVGTFYCPRAKSAIKDFDDKGKIWLNKTMHCHISNMNSIYMAEKITCNEITSRAFEIQVKCYLENGFCAVAWDNRDALWNIFKTGDAAPTAPHFSQIWKNVGKISTKCLSQKAGDFTNWVKSHSSVLVTLKNDIKEKVNSFWDSLKKRVG